MYTFETKITIEKSSESYIVYIAGELVLPPDLFLNVMVAANYSSPVTDVVITEYIAKKIRGFKEAEEMGFFIQVQKGSVVFSKDSVHVQLLLIPLNVMTGDRGLVYTKALNLWSSLQEFISTEVVTQLTLNSSP